MASVGINNLRYFQIFLLCTSTLCGEGCHVIYRVCMGIVEREGLLGRTFFSKVLQERVEVGPWMAFKIMFAMHKHMMGLGLFMFLIGGTLFAFMCLEYYHMSKNDTINDNIKRLYAWGEQIFAKKRQVCVPGGGSCGDVVFGVWFGIWLLFELVFMIPRRCCVFSFRMRVVVAHSGCGDILAM